MARKSRSEKMDARRIKLRKQLWPDVEDEDLWLRDETAGWTTIPRGLSLVSQILDSLSVRKPLSSTYVALWCYSTDPMIITIQRPHQMALESGFTGQRALSTWRDRMKKLEELGFIKSAKGATGSFHYIVLMNPYWAVRELEEGDEHEISRDLYNTLLERAEEIGEETTMVDDEDEEKDELDELLKG